MDIKNAIITGVASYVPDYILTNEELSSMVDTNDEWITTRVGIKERRILKGEGLGSSELGYRAVNELLKKTSVHPDDVELYRSRITLSSLQDIFFGGRKQLTYQFRRCLDNDYISTTMEFLAGNKCDAQNPWIVVIIRKKTV